MSKQLEDFDANLAGEEGKTEETKTRWFQRIKKGILTPSSERKETPEGLWTKCPECNHICTVNDLREQLFVCPKCNFHHRIGSDEYYELLFDDKHYTELFDNILSKALGECCTQEDFLQAGKNLMAAGYVIYGSSTMMVYATRLGVNGFTLEPSIGEFCLSHPDIKCKEQGKIYSVNQGNWSKFSDGIRAYLTRCMDEVKTHRYIGSMVADMHRTLIKGGIFLYPADTSAKKGKLRLMYECNPMAFLVEAAGGMATTGSQRILDVEPTELHQRVPILIGSKGMVEDAVACLKADAITA